MEHDSHVEKPVGQKTAQTKLETWKDEWGEKPADADKYFYVLWRIYGNAQKTSQPYHMYVEENIGAPGEMLGWYFPKTVGDGGYYIENQKFYPGNENDLKKFDLMQYQQWPEIVSINNTRSVTVVVKYPRDEVEKMPGKRVSNNAKIINDGIDGDVKERDVRDSYTYKPVSYEYTEGDYVSPDKTGLSVTNGAINVLMDSGKDLPAGNWVIRARNRAYGLTEEGTKPYTTYLDDGYLYIDGERLNNDDYSISYFTPMSFSEYKAVKDPDKGLTTEQKKPDELSPVKVYIRTLDNPEWHYYGTYKNEGNYVTTWTGLDGTSKTEDRQKIDLPDGTYQVSFRHTSISYNNSMEIYLGTIYHPTDHVKELLKGKSSVTVNNVMSDRIQGPDGEYLKSGNNRTSSIQNWSDVRKLDEEIYGDKNTVFHYGGDHELTKAAAKSTMKKTAHKMKSLSSEKVRYVVSQYDSFSLPWETTVRNEILNLVYNGDIMPMHKEGVFYDLLPQGANVDPDSIVVVKSDRSNSEYGSTTGGLKDVTVEYKENWRDSGRTLMIVRVRLPKGDDNYYREQNPATIGTGFVLSYITETPWTTIADIGPNYKNSAAYESIGSELAKGRTDDGGDIEDSAWLNDLDDSGQAGDSDQVYNYVDLKGTHDVIPAAEFSFLKSVKTPNDTDYKSQTAAMASGEYTYRLRYANDPQRNTKNVVYYDILEEAYNNNEHWKGTFRGVDISNAEAKGIDTKVYYSTSDAPAKMVKDGKTDFTDLSNTELWSDKAPDDLSKVTAIALDFSKAKDGSDYVFKPGESLACYVQMNAPEDAKPYADNPDTEADETVYAYNSAYLRGSTDSGDIAEECNTVKVSVRDPKVELDKTSDSASGTKKEPTKVKVADSLNYTLDLTNKESANALHDLVVEDEVPADLEIDSENIRYYFGQNSDAEALVKDSDNLTMEQSGNKLTFKIKKFPAREQLHITIPTTVKSTADVGAKIDNTAKVTQVNGNKMEFESDTTHHKTNKRLTVKKTWNDENDKYNVRPKSIDVQLYADGEPVEGKVATLNEDNKWQDEFEDLERYQEDGETDIEYTVKEVKVPAGYTSKTIEDGLTVENTANYEDLGETSFAIQKYRTGTTTPVEGAVFELRDGDDKVVDTVTTDANGMASYTFSPSPKKESETYTLCETEAPEGYTMTQETWKVTVTRGDKPTVEIVEDANVIRALWNWTVGLFTGDDADSNYKDGTLTVYNDYNASASFNIEALKKLEGRDLKEGEFNFVIKDQDDNVVAEKSNDAEGKIAFDEITYELNKDKDDTGVHVYTVSEVAGNVKGMTYDKNIFQVKVTVEDKGDGTLEVTPEYSDEEMTFTNKFFDPKIPGGGDGDNTGDADEDNDDPNPDPGKDGGNGGDDGNRDKGANTGDDNPMLLLMGLVAISLGGIVTVVGYRRRA